MYSARLVKASKPNRRIESCFIVRHHRGPSPKIQPIQGCFIVLRMCARRSCQSDSVPGMHGLFEQCQKFAGLRVPRPGHFSTALQHPIVFALHTRTNTKQVSGAEVVVAYGQIYVRPLVKNWPMLIFTFIVCACATASCKKAKSSKRVKR